MVTDRPLHRLPGLTVGVVGVLVLSAMMAVSGAAPSVPGHVSETYGPRGTDRAFAAQENPAVNPPTSVPSISIPVGSSPDAVACDIASGDVFVANLASENVTVINGTTNTVVGSIPAGPDPVAMAYDDTNGYVYLAESALESVLVINGTTDTAVDSIPVGVGPFGVAYDSANGDVFVANIVSDNVSVINGTTDRSFASVAVGPNPDGIAYDSSNGYLYVTGYSTSGHFGNVTVINGTTDAVVGTIPVGVEPDAAAYDSANGYLYVPVAGLNNVTVINGATDRVVASIPVGDTPLSVAVDSSNGYVYVGKDGYPGNLTVINGTTDTIVGWQPVGGSVFALAYDGRNSYVYAANLGLDNVTVVGAIPPLSSVSISPMPSVLGTGESQSFTAAPVCARGYCPTGAVYTWSLSNPLGSLNSTTAPGITVTAGPATGSVTLFVIATLNSRSATTSEAITIVPSLTRVVITPSTVTLSPGSSQTLNVTPLCSAGPCPSNVTYSWSLTDYSLGSLNRSLGTSVDFHASSAGSVSIYVNATALNKTVEASAPITIASPSSSTGLFGLSANGETDLLIGITAGLVMLGAVIFLVLRRRPKTPTAANPPR